MLQLEEGLFLSQNKPLSYLHYQIINVAKIASLGRQELKPAGTTTMMTLHDLEAGVKAQI